MDAVHPEYQTKPAFGWVPPLSGKLSAALFFLYLSGGRDRTMTWDIHRVTSRTVVWLFLKQFRFLITHLAQPLTGWYKW